MEHTHKYILSYFLMLFCILSQSAQAIEKSEYQVKASFLCAFLKYTQFTDDKGPYYIGVVGNNPFKGHLQNAVKKNVNGRSIRIIFFEKNFDPKKAASCHILFFSQSEHLRQKELLQHDIGRKTLTIGDNRWFTNAGGMINLITDPKGIRWEVNSGLLKGKSFKLSSKILRLAINKGGR